MSSKRSGTASVLVREAELCPHQMGVWMNCWRLPSPVLACQPPVRPVHLNVREDSVTTQDTFFWPVQGFTTRSSCGHCND